MLEKMKKLLLLMIMIPVILFADEADIWMAKGEQQMAAQNFTDAIANFSKAIELNDKLTEAYYQRGLAYLFSQKFEYALQDFSQTIELDSTKADAYNNRGYLLYVAGQNDAAITDFNKAIELEPEFTEAYVNRGANYIDLLSYDNALKDLEKAIEMNPKSPSAYLELGRLYYKKNDYKKSIENYSKCIKLGLVDAKIYYNRGNSYFKSNNIKKAIEDYSKAIELDPKDTESLNNRAVAYEQSGQKEKAEADRKRLNTIAGTDNVFIPFEELEFIRLSDSTGSVSYEVPKNWYVAEYHSEFSEEIVITPEKIDNIQSPFSVGVRMSYNKNMGNNYRVSDPDSLLLFWEGSMSRNAQSYHSYQVKSQKQIARVEKNCRINQAIVQFTENDFPIFYYEYALAKQDILFYAFFSCPIKQHPFFDQIFSKTITSIIISDNKAGQ